MKCMTFAQAHRHLHVVADYDAPLSLPPTQRDLGRAVAMRDSFMFTFMLWAAAVAVLFAVADFVR